MSRSVDLPSGSAPPSDRGRRRSPPGLGRKLVATIDATLGRFDRAGSPGVAVLVAREGEVVFEKGYGYTDLTAGERLGRTTPFRLASISKQFTTTAVMILAEWGALGYDEPAAHIVPEIERFGHGITIRHLMTHTSGIPDYYETLHERVDTVPSVDEDTLYTTVDAVATFMEWGEPVFAPGAHYDYSNPGYELLALIVRRLSGRTYGDFLQENVFGPAGMATAVVRDRPEVVIPHRAVGYRHADDGTWKERDEHPLNWIVGSGGVYASLDDLLAWDRALTAHTILSADTLEEAWTPAVLNDGSVSHYGFGWMLSEDGQIVGHSGTWVGFRTRIARSRRTGVTAIALSNASAADAVDSVVEAVMAAEG